MDFYQAIALEKAAAEKAAALAKLEEAERAAAEVDAQLEAAEAAYAARMAEKARPVLFKKFIEQDGV